MRRITTKQRILSYLRLRGRYCSGHELEAQADEWGTKASVISRRARELAAEGYLETSYGKRGAVQYKMLNVVTQPSYTIANDGMWRD